MDEKILKFHYEVMLFILMILSSDIGKYHKEDVMTFAEAIIRLRDINDQSFLYLFKEINVDVDEDFIDSFEGLSGVLKIVDTNSYYEFLTDPILMKGYSELATSLLTKLNQDYIDPLDFMEGYMDL